MAMSAGEMIVRLLLQSNSKEVLTQMSTDARQAERSLDDLVRTAQGFTVTTKGGIIVTEGMNRALKEQERQTADASRSVRQFLADRGLSNRLARETTQAVTAIALAMSFLTDAEGNADESTKAMASSLLRGVAVMNATEFSMFALGKAAEKLPGTLGAIGTRMTALAGPIGIAIGVVTALHTMMSAANAEGEKAEKEGIGKFIDRLSNASGADLGFLRAAVDQMKALRTETKDLLLFTQQMDLGGTGFAAADATGQSGRAGVIAQIKETQKGREDIVAQIEKEIDRQEVLNDFNERFRQIVLKSGNEVQKLQVQLETVNEQLRKGIITSADGKNLIEERVRLTRQLAEILKTSDDKQAERVTTAEHEYQVQRITRAVLIEKLQAELKSAETAERRRQIETEIHRLVEEEKKAVQDINTYWNEAARKAWEQFEAASKQLKENRGQIEIDIIRNASEKKVAEEERRYQKQLDLIKDLELKTQDHDEAAAQRKLAAEINRQNLVAIGQQRELAELQLVADQVGVIGTALHNAFSGAGGELLQKMVAVAQIALQIAKTVQLMNAGALTGALGPIGIAASALGIFGLFDSGGYTGSGHRYQPAGIVHRGEIVFEKPIVDRHKDLLMGVRSVLQSGYARGGMAGGGSFDSSGIAREMVSSSIGSGGSAVAEIRAMRREIVQSIRGIQSFPDEIRVDMVRMQAKLRDEQRGIDRWKSRKTRRSA